MKSIASSTWSMLPLQAFTYAIERSCINKAEVVAADEKEGGVRATLNLGHTFGHAIENVAGYGARTAAGTPAGNTRHSNSKPRTLLSCCPGVLEKRGLPSQAPLLPAGVWLHGEAVAAGTVMAADLSHRLGWIDRALYDRARDLLAAANLPVVPPKVGRRLGMMARFCINGVTSP